MFGFNPYFALAGVIALAAAAGGGFVKGEQHANAVNDQARLHQLVEALDQRDAKQKQIDLLEAAAAAREQQRQTIVREIDREIPTIVHDPVYRNVCVNDAGVRALDRAAAAANGDDSGAPAGGSGQASPAAPHN